MATTRLLLRPLVSHTFQSASSCSSYARKSSPNQSSSSDSNMPSLTGEMSFTRANTGGSRKTFLVGKVATQAVVSTRVTGQRLDVISLWENVVGLLSGFKNMKLNHLQTQGLIERVIIDCRFFTLLAVAGSLIGSVLCFVEGLTMVMKLYFRYFAAALYKLDHGSVAELLIEAIDMFLVGTAMLVFGMGIYVMFVRSKTTNHHKSSAAGLFHLEALPSWLKMESVSEAKTRVGHAVLMILQVGMVEKFKSVPLVTGLDLACFAGALLLSSASIFCLSKLSIAHKLKTDNCARNSQSS